MAILAMKSFDHSRTLTDNGIYGVGGDTPYIISGPSDVWYAPYPRTGPGMLRLGSHPFYAVTVVYHPFVGTSNTVWCQFAYYMHRITDDPAENGTAGSLWGFATDGTMHVYGGFDDTTNKVQVCCPAGTYESTESNLLALNQWQFMEVTAVIADAPNGSFTVKLNGFTKLSVSGIDTKNGGTGIPNRLYQGGCGYAGAGDPAPVGTEIDDLVIGDNTGSFNITAPGDARVEYLVPNAPGIKTEFTPSAGSNWGNVDETGGVSDTDYNYSPSTGAMDIFGMSALGGNGVVHAVAPVLRVRKDDAGYRKVKPVFYKTDGSGNTGRYYLGTDIAATDSFASSQQIFNSSPDTGALWAVGEVNDLQFGYRVTGGGVVTGGEGLFTCDAAIEEF